MSSKAGSSIGAFLLSLPVSAMLLMMVFGIPRFAPGTNAESGWDQARQFFSRLRGESNRAPDEMFGEYPPPPSRVPMDDPFAPVSRVGGSTAEAPRWGTSPASGTPPAREALGAALTWTEARRRLTELGIDQFHLEPGLQRDHYLFVCLFSPGDDPRVTHRFEAEAADPLMAVQDVLSQIDGWLSQRYADRAQQIIPSARGQ